MARRVPNGGTNGRGTNVDAAPLAESTRRDTRSRSLQRMVRRYFDSLRTLRKNPVHRATRDGCPNVKVWNAKTCLAHGTERSQKPSLCRDARSCCAWKVWRRGTRHRLGAMESSNSLATLAWQTPKTETTNRSKLPPLVGRRRKTPHQIGKTADRMRTHEQRTESAPLRAGNWRSLRE